MKRFWTQLQSFLSELSRDMCVVVVMTPLIAILGAYLAIAPVGTPLLLGLSDYFVGSALLGGLASPVCLVLSFFKTNKRTLQGWAFLCAVWLLLTIPSIRIADSIRKAAFVELSLRSETLVDAIKRFETETGQPPRSLEDLVPTFIDLVPETGMGAYPDYLYRVGASVFAEFNGEPWMIYIQTPSGGINFDRFVYVPSEVYPENGPSGFYREVGSWAYYHE